MKAALVLFLGSILVVSGGEWPQFRGPLASGVDRTTALPVSFNVEKGENVRWRTPIPGLAHSSPIVWGDRIYLTTVTSGQNAELKVGLYGDIKSADDNDRQVWRILALDAKSGAVVWDRPGHEAIPRVKRHTKATHCNSTPATDGKRIVTYFGSEGLFCFDTDGKLLWKKDLGPMDSGFFAVPSAQWGLLGSHVSPDQTRIERRDCNSHAALSLCRSACRLPRSLLSRNELKPSKTSQSKAEQLARRTCFGSSDRPNLNGTKSQTITSRRRKNKLLARI
jgi:hypothetical protein